MTTGEYCRVRGGLDAYRAEGSYELVPRERTERRSESKREVEGEQRKYTNLEREES